MLLYFYTHSQVAAYLVLYLAIDPAETLLVIYTLVAVIGSSYHQYIVLPKERRKREKMINELAKVLEKEDIKELEAEAYDLLPGVDDRVSIAKQRTFWAKVKAAW